MKKFKTRCSSLGIVCAVKGFAKTGMSAVELSVKEQIYGIKRDIDSKYLTKGNECEDESIAILSEILGVPAKKNEQEFENEFIKGTPDVVLGDVVSDIKNSYSEQTFPLFDTEPDYKHVMQVKGYAWLLGLKKGRVDYFLMDLPEHLIEKEAWKLVKARGLDEMDIDIYNEAKKMNTYSHLAIELRHKSFEFDVTEKDIEFIKKNVKQANDYGNKLLENYGN